MSEEIKEKYLPIGTVVKLIGGEILLMITGFCIVPAGKLRDSNGEVKIDENTRYDYSACPYPGGMMSSELNILFNHENIEKVFFMGYDTEQHKAYSKFLNEEYEKKYEELKKQFEESNKKENE